MDLLFIAMKKFLQRKVAPGSRLLVGYSGGPDSKAMLYLLLACRKFVDFEPVLAHVDHGWREESAREAALIEEEAAALGVKVCIKALKPEDFTSRSLEDRARELRLDFFTSLYQELGCAALLLGHHADDQAEVVLKRVFEGASLYGLGGLAEEAHLRGMRVWRPLLPFAKAEIGAWLAERRLDAFEDPTNKSPRFLRGRMREEMIPYLSQSFGKEISSNLCRLGEESQEVRDFFKEANRPLIATIENGRLDLGPFLPLPALQIKFLLREWAQKEQASFSKDIIDGIAAAVNENKGKKTFHSKEGSFLIESGLICFSKSSN